MVSDKEKILTTINDAQLLILFKKFCERNQSVENISRLRNIITLSSDKINTIIEIIKREENILLEQDEAQRFLELITAFIKKSEFRRKICQEKKEELMIKQNYKCAICNCSIDKNIHTDHIIPFKYVGDELDNNLQILCSRCNTRKKDNIDYQIRYLLKLI